MPKKKRQFRKIQDHLVKLLSPPENLTLSQWADKFRILSRESSSLYGKWETKTTPYLKEPMDCFTNPEVKKEVLMFGSQVGKTEFLLNGVGYIVHQEPCSIYYMMPSESDAKDFSIRRMAPMIRDTKAITNLFSDARSAGNTILEKKFHGGLLRFVGTNAASPLSSSPVPVVFMDEVDRFTKNIPGEGDPIALVDARQSTFFNRKTVMVSTPTVKGASRIHKEFLLGTQKHYKHLCPNCKTWQEINFVDLVFEHEKTIVNGEVVRKLTSPVTWMCPCCGFEYSKEEIEKTPAKWIADNPGVSTESFWLKGTESPFRSWEDLVTDFFAAKDNPAMLQTFYNTKLGELWENRGDLSVDETGLMQRREDYGTNSDGTPVEVPDDVAFLTCAVDTQDNRFEYEILGHGIAFETWGIKKGVIMGYPNDPEVLRKLEEVITQPRYFKDKKDSLTPYVTFIDSGGHYTDTIYQFCLEQFNEKHRNIYPIRGKGGQGIPFTSPYRKNKIGGYYFEIGVDAGKAQIMHDIEISQPGPYYCHFPMARESGYDSLYFKGLISERLDMVEDRRTHKLKPMWVKIEGRERNEPLDLRNYNLAAADFVSENPETMLEKRRNPEKFEQKRRKKRLNPRQTATFASDLMSDW